MGGLLGDLLPHLDKGITQLLDSPSSDVAAADAWCPRGPSCIQAWERVGWSVASVCLSSRCCWHTPATWEWVVSCPRLTAPACGLITQFNSNLSWKDQGQGAEVRKKEEVCLFPLPLSTTTCLLPWILNESISILYIYSLLLVFLPLVCQIDHMVQSHPAYTQLQEQARQRSVDPFIVELLKHFLARNSSLLTCAMIMFL